MTKRKGAAPEKQTATQTESATDAGSAGGPGAGTNFVGDAYWGQGGRYVVGADGKRRPADDVETLADSQPEE